MEPEGMWFWQFEPFSKLKTTFYEYWTSEHQLKSKLTWPKCPEYEIKTKMEQEQRLQLKILFLLAYNLKIVIKWGGGKGGGGGDEQIFSWWEGWLHPSRGNPDVQHSFIEFRFILSATDSWVSKLHSLHSPISEISPLSPQSWTFCQGLELTWSNWHICI